jgi:hypothetical protein
MPSANFIESESEPFLHARQGVGVGLFSIRHVEVALIMFAVVTRARETSADSEL